MKQASDQQFRFGITSLDHCHNTAARGAINNIYHRIVPLITWN
ncbi:MULTISPECIES: hypothetical protein [unclassified Acinetobacter]|nr:MULTISPECIES: hypothetical protein [unclassified Acinetobacter]